MHRQVLLASTLVALVSIPSYLVGHKLRQGDLSGLMFLTLAGLTACIVLLASAIMRASDR